MNKSEAQAILLQTLDQIDAVERAEGDANRIYMVCCWAYQVDGKTTFGWSGTDDPAFISANLLRTVANHVGDTEALEEDVDFDLGDDGS